MSEVRLIDANAIISFVDAGHLRNPLELAWSDNDVVDMIEGRPTVDAVPVVRCKECNWFKSGIDINGKPFTKCIGANGSVRTYGHTEPDWFCADGERR